MTRPAPGVRTHARGRDAGPRALILGGGGMLGHKLWQTFVPRMETFVTFRKPIGDYSTFGLFDESRVVDGVDVTDLPSLEAAFSRVRPDVVLNAVGIIKQLKEAHDPIASIEINSLLSHRLARLCAAHEARLIHISTDCVFSGRRGNYTEGDEPDPVDLYGRSKLLGEVDYPNALTVRTSMIGRELSTRSGLVEWFIAQRHGRVKGFTRAIYTGFTTQELARILADITVQHTTLSGVWQVSSDPIAKFDLLHLLNDRLQLDVNIEPDASFVCDRSLDSSRYRIATGYAPPSWASMIDEMAADPTSYGNWKRT